MYKITFDQTSMEAEQQIIGDETVHPLLDDINKKRMVIINDQAYRSRDVLRIKKIPKQAEAVEKARLREKLERENKLLT